MKRKAKDILNEAFMTGGNPLDPVLGPSMNSHNPTYTYKVLAFNDYLQAPEQRNKGGVDYVNIGRYVEANNHSGEPIRGRIVKMSKDDDGYIVRVYVLNEKNKKMTSVDIDSIKPINFPDKSQPMDSRSVNMLTLTKYVISESVRHDGPIRFKYKNVDHIATLNEGRVLVAKLFENKVVSAEDLLEESEEMDKAIIEKINNK